MYSYEIPLQIEFKHDLNRKQLGNINLILRSNLDNKLYGKYGLDQLLRYQDSSDKRNINIKISKIIYFILIINLVIFISLM